MPLLRNFYLRPLQYDATSFPEDLVLMETSDRSNFQGRYGPRHPWTGAAASAAGDSYRAALPVRFKQEAKNLASPPGWSQAEIETNSKQMGNLCKEAGDITSASKTGLKPSAPPWLR
jgi:hypothetical protein